MTAPRWKTLLRKLPRGSDGKAVGLKEMLSSFRSATATPHGWRMVLLSIAVSAFVTWIFVLSGLDWAYFVLTQNLGLFGPLIAADGFGYVFPVLVPAGLFIAAWTAPRKGYGPAAIAALISAVLGLAVSMALKSVAGRVSPPHHELGADLANADNSAGFNIGFMNESILGGWPSSHATVAFAVVVSLMVALPAARRLHMICLILAAFIGIGVTFGFHWLSEFVSGAFIGSSIGLWVGGMTVARGSLAQSPITVSDHSQRTHTEL